MSILYFSSNFGAVVIGVLFLITIFTLINYWLIVNKHIKTTKAYIPNDYKSTLIESAYFSTTSLSTSGYGDSYPITQTGQIVVIIQHIAIILLFIGGMFLEPK